MKAVCVDNYVKEYGTRAHLTVGKVYDIEVIIRELSPKDPWIEYHVEKNDHRLRGEYETFRFKLIEDIREEKLNELFNKL